MRPWQVALLALASAVLLRAMPAIGQPSNETPAAAPSPTGSAEWDGFSRWIQAMRTDRLTVETPPHIDLGQIRPGAGLALLDPPVDAPGGLRLFVQEGGRVLLAIEGPAAEPLLTAFDIQLAPVPPRGPLDSGHPALRALTAPGSGLFAGVTDLLTNRPAAVAAPLDLEPAVRFEDGTAFAYHLKLGEGELVVVADASLFINLMLDGADNARFARNIGAWLGRGGAMPVIFAGPETPVRGTYGESSGEPALAGLNEALSDLGRILDPDDLILHLLLAIAIAGTLVFAISVFPGGGPPVTDGPVVSAPGQAEHLAGRTHGPGAPEAPQAPADAPAPDETRGT